MSPFFFAYFSYFPHNPKILPELCTIVRIGNIYSIFLSFKNHFSKLFVPFLFHKYVIAIFEYLLPKFNEIILMIMNWGFFLIETNWDLSRGSFFFFEEPPWLRSGRRRTLKRFNRLFTSPHHVNHFHNYACLLLQLFSVRVSYVMTFFLINLRVITEICGKFFRQSIHFYYTWM